MVPMYLFWVLRNQEKRKKVKKKTQSMERYFAKVILNNYFVAIYDNELRVIIKDEIEGRSYEINNSNVFEMMKRDYDLKDDESNYPF